MNYRTEEINSNKVYVFQDKHKEYEQWCKDNIGIFGWMYVCDDLYVFSQEYAMGLILTV